MAQLLREPITTAAILREMQRRPVLQTGGPCLMWRSARIAINADGRRCRASRLRRNIDMISSMVGLAQRYQGSGNCRQLRRQ
jgi:hypothetical protein